MLSPPKFIYFMKEYCLYNPIKASNTYVIDRSKAKNGFEDKFM